MIGPSGGVIRRSHHKPGTLPDSSDLLLTNDMTIRTPNSANFLEIRIINVQSVILLRESKSYKSQGAIFADDSSLVQSPSEEEMTLGGHLASTHIYNPL